MNSDITDRELVVDLDTWTVSDTHFSHDNIRRLCRRPDDHEDLMWANWTGKIGRSDTVLHLGDLVFRRGYSDTSRLLQELTGQKFLLPGNHDKRTSSWYARHGFTFLRDRVLEVYTTTLGRKFRHTGFYWDSPDGRRVLFSHYPDQMRLDWDVNVHGHIHNNGYPPGCSEERDYRNISVEVVDYSPVRLRDVLDGEDGVHFVSRKKLGLNDFEIRLARRKENGG